MIGQPFEWNTVVLGAWNVAILTPNGIARRLFALEPGTPLEVQVPLDRRAPIRVIHSNVVVMPANSRLEVAPVEATVAGLIQASQVAARAVESLPETPLTAAGINLRYRFDAIPDELIEVLRSTVDDHLAEADFRIVGKALQRCVRWEEGVLNIEAREDENASSALSFNFHRASEEAEDLRGWLGRVESMASATAKLLTSTFRVEVKEEKNE